MKEKERVGLLVFEQIEKSERDLKEKERVGLLMFEQIEKRERFERKRKSGIACV